MDYPLTLTQFFERSRRLFARKTLATRVPGRPLFRYTYADFAERVARLAGGLTALGVCPGERVGTFAWNTHHHLEAYWAVPMMGAVLHTVNFRLSPEDIAYIINHAEDSVLGLDHGVGHPLLLLYDVKAPNGQNRNEFKGLYYYPSDVSLSTF